MECCEIHRLEAHPVSQKLVQMHYVHLIVPNACVSRIIRVPLPESLLNDTSSDSGDDNQDSKGYGCSNLVDGRYMDSGSGRVPAYPRVVDRLRRTRAASAADQAAMQNSA